MGLCSTVPTNDGPMLLQRQMCYSPAAFSVCNVIGEVYHLVLDVSAIEGRLCCHKDLQLISSSNMAVETTTEGSFCTQHSCITGYHPGNRILI